MNDFDLHLFGEGRHERLWEILGAHLRQKRDGVERDGVSFTVWAPRARAVQVLGGFSGWDGSRYEMTRVADSGLWELYIAGVSAGALYRYRVLTASGEWVEKSDPMAQATEVPPSTSSIVAPSSEFAWGDGEWMARRAASAGSAAPMSVYEVHVGSWRSGLGYRELAAPLIDHVLLTGFTHVEFLPLAEHPFGPSWGYQVSGYYAPTSRFGTADDLRYLIDQLHRAGIGVIMDWVPGHFPRDSFALARFDGQPLYEHADPRRGEHQDWGTYIFDYGQRQVRNFLVANALFWLDEFHVDGLRVDAVASMLYLDYSRPAGQWLPNVDGGNTNLEAISFLQEVTATAHRKYPGAVVIAEESTSFQSVTAPTNASGLGFASKWNMGWMNDSLRYMRTDPIQRRDQHALITHSISYAYTERFLLPLSHDEVVHGKGSLLSQMPGDETQRLANLRAYYAFMWAHPGKKLLFMGQEFAQCSEWNSGAELSWSLLDQQRHWGVLALVSALNELYSCTSALWELDDTPDGFRWLVEHDRDNNVVAFTRSDATGTGISAYVNFSGREIDYPVHLPHPTRNRVLLNTDDVRFGGDGRGLPSGHLLADRERMDGECLMLLLPALSGLWLGGR